jgi:hypothetical protein
MLQIRVGGGGGGYCLVPVTWRVLGEWSGWVHIRVSNSVLLTFEDCSLTVLIHSVLWSTKVLLYVFNHLSSSSLYF